MDSHSITKDDSKGSEVSKGSEAHISTVDLHAAGHIDERKLLWKIDYHVVPWLALLYLLNFLDRGSIGNAKVSRSLSDCTIGIY